MYLGIDVGTSAVKVVLVGADLAPMDSESVGLRISHPAPQWSEQSPEEWWVATRTATQAVVARAGVPGAAIKGIGLSGQMHGAVLLDRDKHVIRNAILWNDGRSQAQCDALQADHPALAEVAGVRPMPGFTAPKLLWLRDNEPAALARIAHILLPKDYIGHKLHGGLVTDPSDAAGTFWFDEAKREWSEELCAATATDAGWLPKVIPGDEIAGYLTAEAAAELGLAPGTPVAAGAGDAAAGAIALGTIQDGRGFLSLGTSGQLFLATRRYRAAPDAGLHSYAHTLPGIWFQMAAMLNGARPLSWFAEVTGHPIPALMEEAEASRAQGIPLFLPYLTGERTPHGDALIRGAFYGLENGTSRGEMMRAVVDAVAYSFADAADAVRSVAAMADEMLVIGGGSRSDFLLQTIADATGLALARGAESDVGPAVGAARMAAVAAGGADREALGQMPEIVKRFRPNPDGQARHAPRLESYRQLYRALQPMRQAPR